MPIVMPGDYGDNYRHLAGTDINGFPSPEVGSDLVLLSPVPGVTGHLVRGGVLAGEHHGGGAELERSEGGEDGAQNQRAIAQGEDRRALVVVLGQLGALDEAAAQALVQGVDQERRVALQLLRQRRCGPAAAPAAEDGESTLAAG